MCIDFIASLSSHPSIFRYQFCWVWKYFFFYYKNQQQNSGVKHIKKKHFSTNIRVKTIALQSFFSGVVSQLANLDDTVSFHRANVFFINQQTFWCCSPDRGDCVICEAGCATLRWAPAARGLSLTSPLPQAPLLPCTLIASITVSAVR